jgi:hypothetical protein
MKRLFTDIFKAFLTTYGTDYIIMTYITKLNIILKKTELFVWLRKRTERFYTRYQELVHSVTEPNGKPLIIREINLPN